MSSQARALGEGGGEGGSSGAPLTWWNVALAASMLLLNVFISSIMKLGLEKQIVVAGVRCVVQLTILGLILRHVFTTKSAVLVIGMAASKFIPVLGMLLGNTMVGVTLGMDSVLGALDAQRDVAEAMLCYGASRWEVVQPILVDAMRTAMIPTITSVSIAGLISIPGMMSGQILGGADVMDAARYQQVIVFMIAASTALGVIVAAVTVAFMVVDKEPKIHPELIHTKSVAKPANGSGAKDKHTLRAPRLHAKTKSWRSARLAG
ncbi:hypothetical protein GGI12_005359 [Dipsacomyces acuminosporus]|nr:hypothetical protein GGI12_005359 [Dipsacomyces acuminosporus]